MTAEMELYRCSHEQPSLRYVILDEQDLAAGLTSSPVAPALRTSISRQLLATH